MKMPGFNAEASFDRKAKRIEISSQMMQPNEIIPQAKIDPSDYPFDITKRCHFASVPGPKIPIIDCVMYQDGSVDCWISGWTRMPDRIVWVCGGEKK